MKRRIVPLLVLIPLFLMSCSLFSNVAPDKPLTDAEMATRVADLLATMTTPTAEIIFPPTATPTQALPTVAPTATTDTTQVVVVATPTATVEVAGNLPTATTSAAQNTPVVSGPTATLAPAPTATIPASDPINRLGSPSSTDLMDSNAKWAWPTGADAFLDVQFKDGFMKMTNLSADAAGWRMPLVSQQIDTYIELTANSATCSGKDSYGIIFRVPVFKEPDQGYLYQVTCDGYFRLWKWDGKVQPNGLARSLINWSQSTAINVGANQTNRLGVMVVDDKITLYMNGVQLGAVTDTSYAAGFFGAFVRTGSGGTNYTANFDAMKFWENPAQ